MQQYTPKNIDIEAFEKGLMQERQFEQQKLFVEREKAQAYFSGFDDCVTCVLKMLHCSNYEKREVASDDARIETA